MLLGPHDHELNSSALYSYSLFPFLPLFSHFVGGRSVHARNLLVEEAKIDAQLCAMVNEVIQNPRAPDGVFGVIDPGLLTGNELPIRIPLRRCHRGQNRLDLCYLLIESGRLNLPGFIAGTLTQFVAIFIEVGRTSLGNKFLARSC